MPTGPTNPFLYGKPVGGEHFCDRHDELQRLVAMARSRNSLWLYSPRRYGKTSLIREAFHHLDDVETAFIDLYGINDAMEFADAFLAGITPLAQHLEGSLDRAVKTLTTLVSNLRLQVSLDDAGTPTFSVASPLAAADRDRGLAQVLAIPEQLAAKRGCRVLIACDEFQEVMRVDGLERTLRSVFQHQQHTSFIFSGSQRTLLTTMFTDPDRPFFQYADHMTLERIDEVELLRHVRGRLAHAGTEVPDEVVEDLVRTAQDHPHSTQYFASQLWEVATSGRVPDEALGAAWRERIVANLDSPLRMFFDGLANRQRRFLVHLANHGSDDLFAEQTRREHRLGSSSTLSGAVKALVERDVIEKTDSGRYRFVNPAFELWLRHGLRRR